MVDITFDDVTNASTTTDGTGYFDKIVQTTLLHIQKEASSGRIKGTEYATVYLGGLQSAMQHAIQFVLQEKLTEAQIAGIEQDNLLKAKQVAIAEKELLLKEKELLLKEKEIEALIRNIRLSSIKTGMELVKTAGSDRAVIETIMTDFEIQDSNPVNTTTPSN